MTFILTVLSALLGSHAVLLQSFHTPSHYSVTSQLHQKERFTRRHSVNVPPLPLDPEDRAPPLNRATKRVTMDFSLLSVPPPDLLHDSDSDNDKQAAGGQELELDGNHEENIPIQVFCSRLLHSAFATSNFWLELYRVQETVICNDFENLLVLSMSVCFRNKTYGTLRFVDICTMHPPKVPPNILLFWVSHIRECVCFYQCGGWADLVAFYFPTYFFQML